MIYLKRVISTRRMHKLENRNIEEHFPQTHETAKSGKKRLIELKR